ncbi:hypothetical protein GW587_13325 [Duganella sp. SAP-35]|uniref:Glycoside hydrolase family 97 protein n=2 Tax=Duganella aceris TaxID=2703883 RepID=A0ABX0FKX2_9BURK|nr:hypothetical protein [Duganella aceris]
MSTAGCVAFGTVVSTANVWADETLATASSPGKILDVALQVADDGRLTYQVGRHGKAVIAPSRLGFLLANGDPLDAGFTIARQQVTIHDDTREQPGGERRFVRDHYTQLRVDVRQKDAAGRRLSIVFRVYDDGVAFRYEFVRQARMKALHLSEELTQFVVAEPAVAWWQPAGEVPALEYPVRKTALGEVGMANTPLTVRTDHGTHIAFHDAAQADYPSLWLRRVEGQKLRAHLAPPASGPAVVRKGAFNTPWRAIQIADDAPGLYLSDLVLNLGEASQPAARGMEFQPCGEPQGADGHRFDPTPARRLANAVVVYAPAPMPADPHPHAFSKAMPTDWAETRMPHGAIGAYATVARKDRASQDWYVGAITDGFARVLPLPLGFLDAGKTYLAEIHRDGEPADTGGDARFGLVTERRKVSAADQLTLKLAPGGGQAIRFTPA